MEIRNVIPKPYEKSILPGICFDTEIEYMKYKEAILEINGWLRVNSGKIIAEIKEELSNGAKSVYEI